jgi:hypothetical protein
MVPGGKGYLPASQGISLSFGPSALACISFSRKHPIYKDWQKPIVIFLPDQNFVSRFKGDADRCMAAVRSGNALFSELCGLLLELLDGLSDPLTQVWQKHVCGEWIRCTHRLKSRFALAQICHLVPIIREGQKKKKSLGKACLPASCTASSSWWPGWPQCIAQWHHVDLAIPGPFW